MHIFIAYFHVDDGTHNEDEDKDGDDDDIDDTHR